jgi:hypothetical protein
MKPCLRTNRKTISAGSPSARDRQFRSLCRQRNQFEKRGDPVLGVDGKKRELIGNFKNTGAKWERTSTAVNDHDFRSAAKGIAIPYASTILRPSVTRSTWELPTKHPPSPYPVSANGGLQEGRKRYPQSNHILILADTGGSNGAQRGAWKQEIQRQLCDGLGLYVTLFHYPSGASKWNPIEHRLFSQIGRNRAAEPLDSYHEGPEVYPHRHDRYRPEGGCAAGYRPLPNPASSPQRPHSANSPFDTNVFRPNGTTPSRPKCEIVLGRLLSCRPRGWGHTAQAFGIHAIDPVA